MSENKFCPKCGHAVSPNDEFCPNCGNRLSVAPQATPQQAPSRSSQAANTTAQPNATAPHAPQKPLNKKWLYAIGAIVIVLLGGYLFGRNYYQPNKQVNRMIVALTDKNANAAKYVTSDDPTLKEKVDSTTVAPMQKYFSANKDKAAELKSALEGSGSYDSTYSLVQDGHAWLVFPRYKISVTASYVTLTTNESNVKLYQDNQKVATSSSDTLSKRVGPLFPGTYTFKASGNVSGRHLTNKTTIDVGSDSSDVDLSLKSLSFTVTGNPGAVVYLNDKKIGKINKSGELKVNNYSENGNMELYATMKVDGKTVKSDTIDVEDQVSDDGSSTITPTFSGMVTEDQAQSLLQSAYDETESGSEGSSSADDFVGEEDNSSYNELLEFFDSFSEDESWDVEVSDITSVVPSSNGGATASYKVKYTFYKDDTKKIQQFTYKGAKIVQKDGDFLISTVGKTGKSPDWEKTYDN
jgi:uncharacterized membrane protein YvbJ